MGRRRNQRVSTSLPVRIFGTDSEGKPFVRLAHTVDISTAGVRVAGVYLTLKIGDVVGLQYGNEKHRFRVIWTGKMGSRTAGEIGLETLEPGIHFCGLDLPAGGLDSYEPKPGWTERRKHSRFDCDLGAELRTHADAPPTLLRCTDISRGGCYLETWSPLPVGTKIRLLIRLQDGEFRAEGDVRTTDPAFGMGVHFTTTESTAALDAYLRDLQQSIDHAQTTISAMAPDPAEPDSASAPRVLLAEDSRFLRNAYSLYLRREGFHVVTADDGYQALAAAANEHPDVIILDLLMPRLGGVGALKMLKEDPITASIPVIVLSGLPSSNEAKLTESGAFAYLAKTQVGPEELPRHVKRALVSTKARPLIPPGLSPSYQVGG